jgi:hypothetical protein
MVQASCSSPAAVAALRSNTGDIDAGTELATEHGAPAAAAAPARREARPSEGRALRLCRRLGN